jgi:hypothetical protein
MDIEKFFLLKIFLDNKDENIFLLRNSYLNQYSIENMNNSMKEILNM